MAENESVLGVLMYLFHNHMEKDQHIDLNDMALIDELRTAGFHSHNIGKAFRWLHNLLEFTEKDVPPSTQSFRVFSDFECDLIDLECRSFILSLEHQGVLTPLTREIVIHQTMELKNEEIDLPLVRWVTMMVLFNLPNCDKALAHMEFLMLTPSLEHIH